MSESPSMPTEPRPQEKNLEHAHLPTALDLDLREQVLHITWNDGKASHLPLLAVRKACPCASCRTAQEEQSRTLLPVLKSAPPTQIRATGAQLVGNYALRIEWSDGHNTGIYDFRYLRQNFGTA